MADHLARPTQHGPCLLQLAKAGKRLEVGDVAGLRDMQLARLTVGTHAAEIPHAVGGVGVLLHLGQEDATADCVQGARLDEVHIALLDGNAVELVLDRAVGNGRRKLLRRHFLLHAQIEEGARLGSQDDPHLGLAVGHAVGARIGVIGMHLDGERRGSIDELDEGREGVHHAGVLAQTDRTEVVHVIEEALPCMRARRHDARVVLARGEDPGLPDPLACGIGFSEALAAPDLVDQSRLKAHKFGHATSYFSKARRPSSMQPRMPWFSCRLLGTI